MGCVPWFDGAQPPVDHAFLRTTQSRAAAAARIGAALAARKRGELLALLRPCFARTGPWLQAGKYVSALVSDLPKRNGWTIAQQAGDQTPQRTQRVLNRAVWDTFAAMGVVRRFAVAGLDEAARRQRWYAWALVATASPRHRLLIRRHIKTGELAFHYCHVPAGQPATMTRLIRAAGLRCPVE